MGELRGAEIVAALEEFSRTYHERMMCGVCEVNRPVVWVDLSGTPTKKNYCSICWKRLVKYMHSQYLLGRQYHEVRDDCLRLGL